MAQVVERFNDGLAIMGSNACKMLSAEEINQFWPGMAQELQKIYHVWDRWWTLDSLEVIVKVGDMQVWVAGPPPNFHLVIFTQVCQYPANNILQAVLMFGTKVDEVLPLVVETLEHYALQNDCKFAEVFGRLGWEKKLGKFGYRKSVAVLHKPLGELRRH